MAETPDFDRDIVIGAYRVERIVRGRYPFVYERADHPKLRPLRDRCRLDEVVRPARSEWEKFLLIGDALRRDWKRGSPQRIPPMDAHFILDEMVGGKVFMCGEHATVFVQCCLALGLQARAVFLRNHVGTEVYANDFRKWAVTDGYFGMYYERDGVPLSALELHEAFTQGDFDGIRVVAGPECRVGKLGDLAGQLAYYRNFTVLMRNDFFYGPLADRREPTLSWVGEGAPPLLVAENNIINAARTNCREDLYWTLNQVFIDLHVENRYFGEVCQTPVQRAGREALRHLAVRLETVTPNPSHFAVCFDDAEWQPTAPEFTWHLRPGQNRLQTKAVDQLGLAGPLSEVVLTYQPGHPHTRQRDALVESLLTRLCDEADRRDGRQR